MKIQVGPAKIVLFVTLLCSNLTAHFIEGENIRSNGEVQHITYNQCEPTSQSVIFDLKVKSTEYQCSKLESPLSHTLVLVGNKSESYLLNGFTKTSAKQKEIVIQLEEEDLQVAESSRLDLGHFSGGINLVTLSWKLTLFLVIILSLVSYGHMTLTRTAKLVNEFPGDPIFPFLGSAYAFICPPEKTKDILFKKCEGMGKKCFRIWKFQKPLIFISDAKYVKTLLSTQSLYRYSDIEHFKWVLGEGLLTSAGETWKEDRKLLNPFFNYQRFDGFLSSFNKHSRTLVDSLKTRFKNDDKGKNWHEMFCNLSMDFITEASLGEDTNFQGDKKHTLVKTFYKVVECLKLKITQPILGLPIIWRIFGLGREEPKLRKILEGCIHPIIQERKDKKDVSVYDTSEEKTTKPFIDALIEAGRNHKNITDHICTIFGAGFETISTTMNITSFLLASNPKCQAKVHEELDRIFGNDKKRDVTFADLAEMKYLEMCIKEALRLYPSAPLPDRGAPFDVPLGDGLVIPKGCGVLISLMNLHRDPETFPDPHIFNPDRFTASECAKRSIYEYMPFSAGNRICIGQKYAMMAMKTALSFILREFTVSTETKEKDLQFFIGIIMEPVPPGILLSLSKRS